jgi:hypothetical protein
MGPLLLRLLDLERTARGAGLRWSLLGVRAESDGDQQCDTVGACCTLHPIKRERDVGRIGLPHASLFAPILVTAAMNLPVGGHRT